MHKTSKAAPHKKAAAKKLASFFEKYPVIGVVNMLDLPSPQLQQMKKQLSGKVELFMTKRTITTIALKEVAKKKPEVEKLIAHLGGMPALMFTKENPFSLFKVLKKSKSPAPAKAGQLSPRDIVIPAGPTPFAPGPVISELAAIGIKAGVEGGKVAVKADTTVVKEGQPISAPLASMLARLGIQPMEIGLNVVAVLEEDTLYTEHVLDVDEDKFMVDLAHAAASGINLAIEIGYLSKDTIELLITKAHMNSRNLAVEAEIINDEVKELILEKQSKK